MRRLALGLVVALCLNAAAVTAQSAFGHVDTPDPETRSTASSR